MKRYFPKRLSPELREQLISRILELEPWFQNIEIAEGISTKPGSEYPLNRWRVVEPLLPPSLDGKVCLDVGCGAGFFSLKMREKGAELVVGIDKGEQSNAIEQARFVRDMLEVDNVEYHDLDVYEVDKLNMQFDYVLFLGTLYHLRHPLLALDKLRQVTRRTMILQTVTTKTQDKSVPVPENIPLRSNIFRSPSFPKLHFIEQAMDGDKSCWWLPNFECVVAMLRSAGFYVERCLSESGGYEAYLVCWPRPRLGDLC
jgi:tRNA (mo5U34)-methyltransferase